MLAYTASARAAHMNGMQRTQRLSYSFNGLSRPLVPGVSPGSSIPCNRSLRIIAGSPPMSVQSGGIMSGQNLVFSCVHRGFVKPGMVLRGQAG
jgi:hypothetical protein